MERGRLQQTSDILNRPDTILTIWAVFVVYLIDVL